jgi:tagatose 1,6-diphosphate aldolase
MAAISPGKLWSLRRLADRHGRFSLLALDRCDAATELVVARRAQLLRDPRLAPRAEDDLARLERLLVAELSEYASGVVLDPETYRRAAPSLDPARGVVLALEQAGYVDEPGGRRTLLCRGWSAQEARRLGADAVKLRLWYRADASADVLADQHALVEQVSQEAREHGLAFLLEPMLYALGGAGGGDVPSAGVGDDVCDDPALRPALTLAAIEQFRSERYAVDLFMLEAPLPPAVIPDPDAGDQASAEAQRWFDRMNALVESPWAAVSVGTTSAEQMRRILAYACRSGASGYLAGSAVWWPAAQEFPDWERLRWRLRQESSPALSRAGSILGEYGVGWPETPRHAGAVEIALRPPRPAEPLAPARTSGR